MFPIVLINVVGLTRKHIGEHTPNLRALADSGGMHVLDETLPAVTSTAQASMLTGADASEHGVVGNGWLFKDTREVKFWQQSRFLIQKEPLYVTARRALGEAFTFANLFWWFNQGTCADYYITPKPHYACDGAKEFDIKSHPRDLGSECEREFGKFPFHAFWGPMAGIASSRWISNSTAHVLRTRRPTLTLSYIPHLDYDLQRFGPEFPGLAQNLRDVDSCACTIIEAAKEIEARVIAVSEYGIAAVDKPVYLNRELRRAGLLEVTDGPFGELIDFFESRAFAVCDHQVAHVYFREQGTGSREQSEVVELLQNIDGVGDVLATPEEKRAQGIDHERAGDVVVFAKPGAHFCYHYFLRDARAPDFARTVDIFRKPGYDACELFVDPALALPKLRAARRLLQKKLGFRYKFDLVPLDASLIKGSHGIRSENPDDKPVLLSSSVLDVPPASVKDVRRIVLGMLGVDLAFL
ncbi:MAG: alkaline phosphatase family protein [Planctomycetes bacterium]|nr:alkaline phosphatase family protein [Planctomycetota bacterium]